MGPLDGKVGRLVGTRVGLEVVGRLVGGGVGPDDGEVDRRIVGSGVGPDDGRAIGDRVGRLVRKYVGADDGRTLDESFKVGTADGCLVLVGAAVGVAFTCCVGCTVGDK